MPTGRSKYNQGIKPQPEDILQFMSNCEAEGQYKVRYTTLHNVSPHGMHRLETTIQFYTIIEERAWVVVERKFLWPTSEGREYMGALLIELHRAYRTFDDIAHWGVAK